MDNFNSPYSQTARTSYPSQSGEYIALEAGGGIDHHSSNFQQRPTRGGGGGRGDGGGEGRGRNFNYGYGNRVNKRYFEDRTPQRNYYQSKQKRWSDPNDESNTNFQRQNHNAYRGRRQNFGRKPNFPKSSPEKFDISQYFHPTMLEDPWKDLIHQSERKDADSDDMKKEDSNTTEENSNDDSS